MILSSPTAADWYLGNSSSVHTLLAMYTTSAIAANPILLLSERV